MAIIAVDMTPALPGGKNGGAKILAVELLKSFQAMAPEDQFIVLTASWNHDDLAVLDGPNMYRLCVLKGEEPGPKRTTAKYPGAFLRGMGRIRRHLKGMFRGGTFPGRLLTAKGVDLLFCPFTAPTYAEPDIPTVAVILDLQHRDLPHFFTPHEIDLRNAFMNDVKKKTDHIICISDYVHQTVIAQLGTNPERTHAVHVCIQSRLSVLDKETVSHHRMRLGIGQRPYMFYPANFWPHKNHRMLLTAYGMFLARNRDRDIDLVFTGALDDMEKTLKRDVSRMGLGQRVHFLGFLPQEKLEAVWNGCQFLVFPSLYEGFGIPLVEAMSMGKPVLCSNCTSLPEVAGDAALYFDPRKPEEISQAMERILGDSALREELIRRGYRQAQHFRPDRMTGGYLNIFHSAMAVPKSLCNGVKGIFEDGWMNEEVIVTFGPGDEGRVLEFHLEAPQWLPARRLKLEFLDGGAVLKRVRIRRGSKEKIRLGLPDTQGRIVMWASPACRPSECGLGEDSRSLGAFCHGCRVILPGNKSIPLLN